MNLGHVELEEYEMRRRREQVFQNAQKRFHFGHLHCVCVRKNGCANPRRRDILVKPLLFGQKCVIALAWFFGIMFSRTT